MPARLAVMIALSASLAGCGGSSPATPSPAGPPGYEGQWSGTTFQGQPIAFTVAAGPKVTAITIGYRFNGCSGTKTFSDLNLPVGTSPFPGAPSMPPGFGFGTGTPEAGEFTQIYGNFQTDSTATGTVVFGDYAGCGTALALWSATKR